MAEPTHHWTALRKMELVQDVASGRAERPAALAAHEISDEEFTAWEQAYALLGLVGLRTGRARLTPATGTSVPDTAGAS